MLHSVGNSLGTTLLGTADLDILPISYAEPPHWPISGWRGDVKRVCDIVFALFALVVLFIPMLLTALAIRLESRGPAPVPPAPYRLRQCRLRDMEVPNDVPPRIGTGPADADHAA